LDSLAEFATVDVFTDASTPTPDCSIRQFLPMSDFPYTLGRYDRIVSVVGNAALYHQKIVELLSRYGGACIEHDNRLVELYWQWRGGAECARMASKALGRRVDLEEVERWAASPQHALSLFMDEVVRAADPLIVHSRGIQAHIERQYGVRPEYLPFCVYRHFDRAALNRRAYEAARRRLGIHPGTVAVVSLGIVDPTKAPQTCVWALKSLRSAGIDAALYFVGSAPSPVANTTAELARKIGLDRFVHLNTAWVDDEMYCDFLTAADFAIQLRTHRFGGLSGSVMDCISAGLRTVVNEDLAAAMEVPGYVMSVSDSLDPGTIAERIARAYETDKTHSRLSPERDDYIAQHSFRSYAVQLLRLLRIEPPRE
jgi:glycosyltransferase involved in cell wall biosynthesis